MEPTSQELLKNTEIKILTNFSYGFDLQTRLFANEFLTGNYREILNNKFCSVYIKSFVNDEDLAITLSDAIDAEPSSNFEIFCAGIASLLLFVQSNWTGPEISADIEWLLPKRDEAVAALSLQDQCNENMVNPELLYFSKMIFANQTMQSVHETANWWLLRTNLLHQFVLEDASAELFDETDSLIENMCSFDILDDNYLETLFHVEAMQFYLYHRRIQSIEKHLEAAQKSAKLSMELVGALGKRTRYQLDEKPQLLLKVTTNKENFPSRACEDVPTALELNDDIRLERVEFSQAEDIVELGGMEEAIVLAKCFQILRSQPKDSLRDEEIMPYLNNVIENSQNWSLRMSSLCQRCILESYHKRTVERSLSQTEYLIGRLNAEKPMVSNRVDLFFASGLKPIWQVKQILADLMINLGVIKAALDYYLELRLWEEVIVCYTILELRHKAAEIIEQEIAKKPTVKLWCLLGDATNDIKCYETAWELSGHKSSRAQRHWGLYYFAKQNYTEAVPHLKLSAELNNIQENVWIRLGFAALQIEDWKLAATAYRHYCALEQTNFEAWNNLAKAYIKTGEKERAWRSLQDAIKCNYDKWQVWDNLMVVSVDLGHFSEVIRCYHRILELKTQHTDVQVLRILTRAVMDKIIDADGNPADRLLPKALELFGHLTSAVPNNPAIWQMYAELTSVKNTDIDQQKAGQYLQRAYRNAVADPRWFKEVETSKNVLELCEDLAATYLKCAEFGSQVQQKAILGSAKLSLQSVVKKVKEQEWEGQTEIDDRLRNVETYLNEVVEKLSVMNKTQ